MQLHSDSGVDPLLTPSPPILLPSLSPFVPFFPSFPPPSRSQFPSCFASHLSSPRATKRPASQIEGLGSAQASPSGDRMHFSAFQFKMFSFPVANHRSFGSISPNHRSIFGGNKVIGASSSQTLGDVSTLPNGLVFSTILLSVGLLRLNNKGKAEYLYSVLHGKYHFKALRHGSHSFTCNKQNACLTS